MKTVVFDLDGTLADTSADLISAANFCFDSLGYPKLLDCKEDAGVAMRGGRAMLELGCQKIGLNDEQLFTNNIRFFSTLILKVWTSTLNFSRTRWTLFVSCNCLG